MGQRKEWLTLGNETLLARAVRTISEAASPVVVATKPDSPVPTIPSNVRIVHDERPDQGPLGGIVAGFSALPESSLVFVTSCDAPFITPGIIGFLAALLGDDSAVIPMIAGFPQPLLGIYRRNILDVARQLLSSPGKGPRDLLNLVPTRLVNETELQAIDPELQTFQSFNTPEEWNRIITLHSRASRAN